MTAIFAFWIEWKIWLINAVGVSNDAMHVHFALLILCVTALIFRVRPDHVMPWLVVLLLETMNEWADLQGSAPGEATFTASLHDMVNTMFWPTLLLLLGRWIFPAIASQRAGRNGAGDVSGDLA